MKPSRTLPISIAVNLLLAAAWFALRAKPAATRAEQIVSTTATIAKQSAAAPAKIPSPANLKFNWHDIESEDYRRYIANLRATGCPERLIRDIIVADIQTLYEGKSEEVKATPLVFEPWAGADTRNSARLALDTKVNNLSDEKRALIKELLGVDWVDHVNQDFEEASLFHLLLGFVPVDKQTQVLALTKNASDQSQRVREEADGIFIDEDEARLKSITDAMMTGLSQTLAPDELDELDHRAQAFAFVMNGQFHLDGVQVSGAEFRQIMGFSRGMSHVLLDEITHNFSDDLSEEEQARRKAVFETQVANLLGSARFADYQLAQRDEFRTALDFTKEKHLSKAAAISTANAMEFADKQRQQIAKDKSISDDERAVALKVLAATTKSSIAAALGASAQEFITNKVSIIKELEAEKTARRPNQ